MSKPHHVKTIVYQRYASRSDVGPLLHGLTSRSSTGLSRSQSPSSRSHSPLPDHNTLRSNNEEISKYLILLKEQRDELTMLIEKQESEKKQLKTEIARLKYKFKLVAKSLNQRIMTYERYDQTIKEAETLFKKIVVSSDTLLGAVRKDAGVLEETINKKVGTEVSTLPLKKQPGPLSTSQIKIRKSRSKLKVAALQKDTVLKEPPVYETPVEINPQNTESNLNFAFQSLTASNVQQAPKQQTFTQDIEEPHKDESQLRPQFAVASYPKLSLFGLGQVDSIDYI